MFFQVIEVAGTIITILGVFGIWHAIARRVQPILNLQASLDELHVLIANNHNEAKGKWEMLSNEDGMIGSRLTPIESMAHSLRESLPLALATQDQIAARQEQLTERVDKHDVRIERLEKKVLGE